MCIYICMCIIYYVSAIVFVLHSVHPLELVDRLKR